MFSTMVIQDFIKIGDDVNLSYLNNDFDLPYDSVVGEGFEEKYRDYNDYYVMMHEIGHSLEAQQVSPLSNPNSVFSSEQNLLRENNSEIVGFVATIKLMHENNEPEEFINEWIEGKIDYSQNTLGTDKLMQKDDELIYDDHASLTSFAFIKDMYENNKELILNMPLNKLPQFADIVSTNILEHDFTEDIKLGIQDPKNKNENDKFNENMKAFKNFKNEAKYQPENYSVRVEAFKAMSENLEVKKVDRAFTGFLAEQNIGIRDFSEEQLRDKVLELMTFRGNEPSPINMTNDEGQELISKSNMTSFPAANEKIQEKLNEVSFHLDHDQELKDENKNKRRSRNAMKMKLEV